MIIYGVQLLRCALVFSLLGVICATASFAGSSKSIIELYTSQGCSVCPTAQALLKTYTGRPDIIALSFNVDYWDYLGWKDTLGKPAHSKRQRDYARARGDGKVFTPQIVANGLEYAVGTNQSQIERAIAKSALRLSGNRVALELQSNKSSFTIKVGAGAKPIRSATIYIASVSPTITVNIKGGENRGRRVTFHNVVRNMIPVGMWSGEATSIRLLKQDVLNGAGERCVVLVQAANTGSVLAAEWMPE